MIKTNRNLCCFLTHDFKPVFLEINSNADEYFASMPINSTSVCSMKG